MDCSLKTQASIKSLIQTLQLPESFNNIIQSVYLPLAQIILDKKQEKPLFISINGAQGTGKSTLSQFLKHIIESATDYSVADISIDNFYLTRKERQLLAADVHPLLVTRGVPGTHDKILMEDTLSALFERNYCSLPIFDKSIDDQISKDKWKPCNKNKKKSVEIILFEGWCNNSPYQSASDLRIPINELEEKEDAEGIWRNYANEQLKIYHEKIFMHADLNIMLAAPNFERIYEWRSLQEEKLIQHSQNIKSSKTMSPDELKRFIQHYERISRHTLKTLPKTADIVIPISENHSMNKIIQRSNEEK